VKKSSGDYVVKDLAEVMSQTRLMGPIVETWKSLGVGPTLLFAVNVEHSKMLCAQFIKAGISAEHIDAKTKNSERELAIDRLRSGVTSVLCNVGLLGTGFDLPPISTIIMARPTLSYPLWMQMIGRGTRPYPGKKEVRILDHAGNTFKHGYYETHRYASLSGKAPLVRLEIHTCSACYACYDASLKACPAPLASGEICGHPRPEPKKKESKARDDESLDLTELTPEQLEIVKREIWMRETAMKAARQGFKPSFTFLQAKSRYGIEIAKTAWPIIRSVYGN
jgi:DNA repair protein RadD